MHLLLFACIYSIQGDFINFFVSIYLKLFGCLINHPVIWILFAETEKNKLKKHPRAYLYINNGLSIIFIEFA